MVRTLATHVAPRETAKFVIDQRHEFDQRLLIATTPAYEQFSHILRGDFRHKRTPKRPKLGGTARDKGQPRPVPATRESPQGAFAIALLAVIVPIPSES